MKRMKKLLTGLLTLGMTLSMMTMTAFAAEPSEKMPTIDTDKNVSLTIHKYEYNGDTTAQQKGTGSASDKAPDGAKPLPGVQFTIWKVAKLDSYYGKDDAALPKVEDFELTGKGADAELKIKTTGEVVTDKKSGKTDTDGEIIFDKTKVSQGLYYVSETDAPANVTTKTGPFLVSLPMTNAEGDGWIYDVHVFPKNGTTYGGVTLVKQGKVGTNPVEYLPDAEFILQMKDKEDTAKWDYLKYDDSSTSTSTSAKWTYTGVASTDATKFKTDRNGKINVQGLTAGTYRFIEVSAPNGYIMDGTKEYQFTINNAGKVTWEEDARGIGETSSEGEAYSAIVTITNEKPDTEKFVMDRTNKDWEADADYRVGAKVPYLIRVDVPSNVEKLKTFKLTDTMTNLTFEDGSFKIYETKETDYTSKTAILTGITPTGTGKTWTIDFNTVDIATGTITSAVEGYAGKSIYIYFEATLDEGAKMTSDGNPNNITLDYSNAIYPTGDPSNPNNGKDPKVDYIKDVVNVFTFGINVTKKDGETGAVLNDVEFDLYRVNDGVTLPVSPDKVTEEWLKKAENAKKIGSGKTKDQGELSFNGLDNATYYLVETQTKAGYNLLKEPYKAVLNLTAKFTKETTKKITPDSMNGTATIVTTETQTTTDYGTGNGVKATKGKFEVTVKNYKGFTLPTTGGIGTFVFTFAGIAMMAAAVILLITGKKKKAE